MHICFLANELKELILVEVYERQCFEVVMSDKPFRTIYDMLWSYKNDMARGIILKWLVWFSYSVMHLPWTCPSTTTAYKSFYDLIKNAFDKICSKETKHDIFDNKALKWYEIENKLPRKLKVLLKVRNKRYIESNVLSLHNKTIGFGRDPPSFNRRRLLILYIRRNFGSLPNEIKCDICGLYEAQITYPCKHKLCKNCFTSNVDQNIKICEVNDENKDYLYCRSLLKAKGWNYYIQQHYPRKDILKFCKRCKCLCIAKFFHTNNECKNCHVSTIHYH